MHATQIRKAFHREGWVFEEKYDGRQLVSRPGRDHTSRLEARRPGVFQKPCRSSLRKYALRQRVILHLPVFRNQVFDDQQPAD